MNAEIIAIGTELLIGDTLDTNSAFLAGRLPRLGLNLRWVTIVGDDMELLIDALQRAVGRSDYVFTSGGLGPTEDDITSEAVARMLGQEMSTDPILLSELEEYFQRMHRNMAPSNIRQAALIPSALSLANRHGSAPGWWVDHQGGIIVTLPGPPGELEKMWETEVVPKIKLRNQGEVIVLRTLKTSGLAEANINDVIGHLMHSPNPYLGMYAKPDGIYLRIHARAPNEESALTLIQPIEREIRSLLEDQIWGADEDTPNIMAGRLLQEKSLTLATMESCTGGLLASTITDVPGSSQYFKGGIIAYNNIVKITNGVDPKLIEQHGAISPQVAEAMAIAAAQGLEADVGIGITGVAGPFEQEGKAVGTVNISVTYKGETRTSHHQMPPRRPLVKNRAVVASLLALVQLLRSHDQTQRQA